MRVSAKVCIIALLLCGLNLGRLSSNDEDSDLPEEFKSRLRALYRDSRTSDVAQSEWRKAWNNNRDNIRFLVYTFELLSVRAGFQHIPVDSQNPSLMQLVKIGGRAVPFLCKAASNYFNKNVVAFSYVVAALRIIADEKCAPVVLDLYKKSVSFMEENSEKGMEKSRPLACKKALAEIGDFSVIPYFLEEMAYKLQEQKQRFDGSTVEQQVVIHRRNWAYLVLKKITKQMLPYTPANPRKEEIAAWKKWWEENRNKDKGALLEKDLRNSVDNLFSAEQKKAIESSEKLKLHANPRSFLTVLDALSKSEKSPTLKAALVEVCYIIANRMNEKSADLPALPPQQGKPSQWQLWWLQVRSSFPRQSLPKGLTEAGILKGFVENIGKDAELAKKHKHLLEKTLEDLKKMEDSGEQE